MLPFLLLFILICPGTNLAMQSPSSQPDIPSPTLEFHQTNVLGMNYTSIYAHNLITTTIIFQRYTVSRIIAHKKGKRHISFQGNTERTTDYHETMSSRQASKLFRKFIKTHDLEDKIGELLSFPAPGR